MNDQPSAEKTINGSLSQIKYELLTIQSGLERYSGALRRIYEETNKELKDPISTPQQSWEGLSLTGKVKYLEELAKEIELSINVLHDRFEKLV
jgi:hypothetical protein